MRSRQPELYRHLIHRFDSLVLANVMRSVGGLQSRAAEVLGLSRPTLRAKLRTIARSQGAPMIPEAGNMSLGDNLSASRQIWTDRATQH
jgi:hypothetical protein